MIRRLYVHNFRCLENFELSISGQSSVLLIGKNGTGKSTVAFALAILQQIARGTNRVHDLIKPEDLTRGNIDIPVRFEIEAVLEKRTYSYTVAFELPEKFKELRVFEERLSVDGNPVYSREIAQVQLSRTDRAARFPIDWHMVALPIVQEQSSKDPLFIFKDWLARMLILRPVPSLIRGDSEEETLRPNMLVTDFGAWFSGLMALAPSAYVQVNDYLRRVMPDWKDIQNPLVGKNARSLIIQFSTDQGSTRLPFEALSDGEKCFMICALVLAARETYDQSFCFWDEPDNHLSLDEVGHLVVALRKSFRSGGQFIATSHNPEAIRRFSEENTLMLFRRNHLEPTLVRGMEQLQIHGDLVGALIRGDVEP